MCGREQIVAVIRALRLILAQALDFPGNDEIFVAAKGDAMLGGKTFSAFGDEIDVRAVAENLAGGANRIAQALDATYAAAAQGRAIHDEGVELDFAVAVQETAAAGVEGFVVFENDDGFFDRVKSRAAAFQNAPSGSGGVAHAVEVSFDHVVGNGPGTAMNYQNWIGWQVSTPQKNPASSLAPGKTALFGVEDGWRLPEALPLRIGRTWRSEIEGCS